MTKTLTHTEILYFPEFSCLCVFWISTTVYKKHVHTHILAVSITPRIPPKKLRQKTPFPNPKQSFGKECGGFGEFDLLHTDESLESFESHCSKPTVPLDKKVDACWRLANRAVFFFKFPVFLWKKIHFLLCKNCPTHCFFQKVWNCSQIISCWLRSARGVRNGAPDVYLLFKVKLRTRRNVNVWKWRHIV